MMALRPLTLAACTLALTAAGSADTIVQEGSVSGSGQQTVQVVLDAFDTLNNQRHLNFVQLDLITSIRGGYEIDGTGGSVRILARLSADYSLDREVLAETEALISDTVQNVGDPRAVSVFDTDAPTIVIDDPAALTPWIGTGDVVLDVDVDFIVRETPPNIINFSAGGTVRYQVTYDFSEGPGPSPEPCADIDGDGLVTVNDLVVLVLTFGQAGPDLPADLDGNGIVDVNDLLRLLVQFGEECPPS